MLLLFFFRYEATSDNLNITAQCTGDYGFLNSTGGFSRFSRMEQLLIQPKRSVIITPAGPTTGIESHNLGKEMKRSAFRVFSALAASDEDIRKKVILINKTFWPKSGNLNLFEWNYAESLIIGHIFTK